MKAIPNISFQSEAKNKDFELLNLAKLFEKLDTFKDHDPRLPHRIYFFALLIVTKGTGKHQIDLKEYDLKAGTVLKIAKGQVHAFQQDPTYEGYLILFTEEFVINYFSKSSFKLISHLYNYHLSSPIAFDQDGNKKLIDNLSTELKSKNAFAQNNIIAAHLDLYLLKLERSANAKGIQIKEPKLHDSFVQFKNLVETEYTLTRNVKDYADKMFVTTKYLNTVIKEFTINTAKNFIDDFVLLEAKREIVSTHKSLKEIAYDMGFDEVTNFTKFFKKHSGITPRAFRNKQLL
ncbi:AraC family transcriptional regulator [Putridiphycobacter roseus]|uniref:AraC family transcriptional regulator n=1 Tax=Putridiphycobacter roseus TaxID=2219161 RepID=A0A2W1NPY8_9FLAO|nr:helix-turn-helix domain-containing protein [Putridiphycobacter roseus]PZE16688.1 AraC family transcriptional regulator [Putridiphycobacter roseus]